MTKHTYTKCRCGHPTCNQYILSTQGSAGFDLADAQLYVAAPDLYEALAACVIFSDANGMVNGVNVRAALAKARGEQ